ncbi:hypothetical protein DIPPA_20425 [Diplonema papillatum]|nr:hypothetical protein DIPPA_20425 [Diplonema papillatum]
MFCNVDQEVFKLGATECHECAVNEEASDAMLRTLDHWIALQDSSAPLDLFESIPMTPDGGPGSLLKKSDMEISSRLLSQQAAALLSSRTNQNVLNGGAEPTACLMAS